ncbi:unnamed protein product [Rotaria sordida]|uniref:Uncharacterized protein n=1 Tax=Rotaria sordida TaxID=392033 RepID=A0A814IJK2_9BILA|nr:unnamed protein product [Rotaria sordida]CAF1024419.1 unnamed protein product [Rotaria sordida]
MSEPHISYVPNQSGRFIRYPYAQRTSSNRFVELGRFFYNLIRAILQLFHLVHYSIATFNNMLSSLPFCIRYMVHLLFSICFPFYTIYQSSMLLINRIHRIAYPIYRAITLFTRLLNFFVTLPLRIITFLTTQIHVLLRNLLILLIFAAIIIGLIVLFSDDNQLNYIKSYTRNTTDWILKQSSMI